MRFPLIIGVVVCCAILCGCMTASPWKIAGGPESCRQICESWGLEFTAMVAVGDQDPTIRDGATACVCQPVGLATSTPSQAAVAVATSLAAPIQQENEEDDDDDDEVVVEEENDDEEDNS